MDALCVIAYWLAAHKFDEDQLVQARTTLRHHPRPTRQPPRGIVGVLAVKPQFIVKSKSLQFITTGLLSGAIAFVKLYLCTIADPSSPGACEHKAPGMHRTFRFEFALFVLRTLLVWVTFILLCNFEALQVKPPSRAPAVSPSSRAMSPRIVSLAAGSQLPCSPPSQAWKRARDQAAVRMAAIERRGLLGRRATALVLLLAWALALGAAVSLVSAWQVTDV